jgi:para-nitrobenzyl esterase
LKESTAQAFADGHVLHIPLIIGTNSFEASLLASLRLPPTAFLAGAPAAAKPAYADLPDDTARGRAMFTDAVMGAPARWIAGRAHGGPAWLYQFAFTPTALKTIAPGPGHAGEIPFVFDSWSTMGPEGEGLKPAPDDLAVTRMVHGCWVAFAKTGVPICPGAPAWPPYSDRYDTLLRFDRAASLETHFRMPQYSALQAAILPTLQLSKITSEPAPPPPHEGD